MCFLPRLVPLSLLHFTVQTRLLWVEAVSLLPCLYARNVRVCTIQASETASYILHERPLARRLLYVLRPVWPHSPQFAALRGSSFFLSSLRDLPPLSFSLSLRSCLLHLGVLFLLTVAALPSLSFGLGFSFIPSFLHPHLTSGSSSSQPPSLPLAFARLPADFHSFIHYPSTCKPNHQPNNRAGSRKWVVQIRSRSSTSMKLQS